MIQLRCFKKNGSEGHSAQPDETVTQKPMSIITRVRGDTVPVKRAVSPDASPATRCPVLLRSSKVTAKGTVSGVPAPSPWPPSCRGYIQSTCVPLSLSLLPPYTLGQGRETFRDPAWGQSSHLELYAALIHHRTGSLLCCIMAEKTVCGSGWSRTHDPLASASFSKSYRRAPPQLARNNSFSV